jgi:hypothetical protein
MTKFITEGKECISSNFVASKVPNKLKSKETPNITIKAKEAKTNFQF